MPGAAKHPLLQTSVLRLSLLYVIVFSLATSLLLGMLYVYVASALDRETDDVIAAEMQGLAEQYSERGLDGLAAVIEERARTAGRQGDLYLLADQALVPMAGNLPLWPQKQLSTDRWIEFEVSVAGASGFEPHGVRAGLYTLPGGYHLLVGTDIREREAFKELIGWTLLASVLLVIVLGALIGYWMNLRVLGRVHAISAAGREIIDGNFSRRLPRGRLGDEFDTLAANLNEMLDRIEYLTAALRFVIDSTAHDLRSPLSRMRARIEAGLSAVESEAARRTLQETLRDAELVHRTLDSLLRIAQAQGGAGATELAPLDLGDLAAEMAELYEPVATDRRTVLRVVRAGPAVIHGSRQLLAHAVANLVDNALKYTPAGGSIELRVGRAGGRVQLVVADTGPGIPAADRELVLQRFVRLGDSSAAPGTGLGLSLVSAVTRLHRATLTLMDNDPGLKVVIEFPAEP